MQLIVNHNGIFWAVVIKIRFGTNNRNYKILMRLIKWCNENLINTWHYTGYNGMYYINQLIETTWYFSNEEDAMLFELTWG